MSLVSPSFESPMDKIDAVPAGFGKVKADIEKILKFSVIQVQLSKLNMKN